MTELYRHFDEDGRLLYVGISFSAYQRYRAHMTPLQYAQNLAAALHAKHFSEVSQWRVADDLLTVLTQIDNMTTALVRES